jgi:hypothetical protein
MSKVTGTFGATGSSTPIAGSPTRRSMGLSLSGTWAGTVNLEWSFDGGETYTVLEAFTANAAKIAECPSDLILYRVTCSAYTSGSVVYGIAN